MDKKVIKIAQRYAENVKNLLPAKMIILYGSHVTGTATKTSDIDIAVVVDKIQGDYLQLSADLFNLVRGINKRIEPVLLCQSTDRSGFLDRIIKHGKIIYQSKN